MTQNSSRAVVATSYGGREVLQITEIDPGHPGPGEVRIAVRAAGVNPYDIKLYGGTYGQDEAKLPLRLGSEASGEVTEVGEGVGHFSVGDAVVAFRASGAYASDLVVPVDAVFSKPASLGWEEAAGLLLTGTTAVHALTATAVGEQDTVLVHGGSGGVGQAVIQLAVLRGARVIATAGESNHDLVRDVGAEPVRYGEGLLERVHAIAPDGVDAALDLVGTDEALEVSLALVADRDRIATIANFSRGPHEGIKLLGGGPGADPGNEIRDPARADLLALAGQGRLRVRVAGTFALDEVAEAHRVVAGGHATGKIVLLP